MPFYCPYCNSELRERSRECPACMLSLPRTERLLGAVPRFSHGVGDTIGILSKNMRRRLLSHIDSIKLRFPQIDIQILAHAFSEEYSMQLQLFRFFNSPHMGAGAKVAGKNRLVFIAVDPYTFKTAIMLGYGLEPFISQKTMDEILAVGDENWRRNEWENALHKILDALAKALEQAVRTASQVLGKELCISTEGKQY